MGNNKSKSCTVLVLGLSNVGKSHFLNLVEFGTFMTTYPTNGYNECNINVDKQRISFIEYGFQTPWGHLFHSIDIVYVLVRFDFSIEQIMETKSIILKMCKQTPLCVLYCGKKDNAEQQKRICRILQLKFIKNIPIAQIAIDFDDKNSWKEGFARLLEWTIAIGNNVTKK